MIFQELTYLKVLWLDNNYMEHYLRTYLKSTA